MNKKGKTDNSTEKKDSCKVFDVFLKKASSGLYFLQSINQ